MQNKTLTDIAGNRFIVLHLDNPLGKGSFGEVFACSVTPVVHFPTVVKVFKTHKITQTQRGFIHKQIQTHSQLVHPNVIRVLSLKIWSLNHFYLVMERADETLSSLLTQLTLTPPQIYSLLYRINQSLLYLQQKKLVHQDIKPQNILFLDGIPKLSDFGLVQMANKMGGIGGSLTYLSPQKYGTDYVQDIRGDIFSLGLVIWKCLFEDRAYKFNFHLLRKIRPAEVYECFKQKYNQPLNMANSAEQEVRPLAMLLLNMIHPDQDKRPTPEQLKLQLLELQGKYGKPLEKIYQPKSSDFSYREPNLQAKSSTVLIRQLENFQDQEKLTFIQFYKELTRFCYQLFENMSLIMLCQTRGVELKILKELQQAVYKKLLYWILKIKSHPLFEKLNNELPQANFILKHLQNCKFIIQISSKTQPQVSQDPKQIWNLFTLVFIAMSNNFLNFQNISMLWAIERTKRYMQAKSLKEIIRLMDEEEKVVSADDRLGWIRKFYKNIQLVVEMD